MRSLSLSRRFLSKWNLSATCCAWEAPLRAVDSEQVLQNSREVLQSAALQYFPRSASGSLFSQSSPVANSCRSILQTAFPSGLRKIFGSESLEPT